MKILRYQEGASVEATDKALQGLVEATAAGGVFVLSFTEAGALSNTVLERTIGKFEASQMYGGPALACAQIVRGDGAQQDELCAARGITEIPTTEVWRAGKLEAKVSAFELESTLVRLGLRSGDTSTWKNAAKGSNDGGTGLPSATAVDEIDFTGGAGEGGRPIDTGRRKDRGTTQDYFPFGETDKPGDDLGDGK